MNRLFHIAYREFAATVFTKAFFFGVVVVPLIITALIPVAVLLVSQKPPAVRGSVAIIDRSGPPGTEQGLVMPSLMELLSQEAIEARIKDDVAQVAKVTGEFLDKIPGAEAGGKAIEAAASQASKDIAQIEARALPSDADVDAAKQELIGGSMDDGSKLALVVIAPDAVAKDPAKEEYGTYELFIKSNLDARVQDLVRDQVREAIITTRIQSAGQDPTKIRAMTRLPRPDAIAVTKDGQEKSSEFQQFIVPVAFMILLWIAVLTGGQYLLYSTIEEKSNRVMEVLLSAVSPMQLMTGKIVGQLAAAFLVLVLYSGTGIVALIYLGSRGQIEWTNLIYLFIFFFIAFFTIAAMMAAIGSAVSDVHEAQTLLTPVMLVIMTPMLLMMPIIFNPKSWMATILSFLPPINPFVMILRISSTDPPPFWQIALSIAIGLVTVYISLRLAAKIFRVGVLMYGKPPNLATLIRWIRMA
jgi:ABC-2 type transport system permease protein